MNRQQTIETRLAALEPVFVEVVNESHMHSVPENSETHFRITVVSAEFEGKSPVSRHRRVNGLLADELAAGLHALALHTRTPEEWFEQGGEVPESPQCMGGSRQD